MRKSLLFLVLSIFILPLSAQNECAFILEEAQDMFDAGLIETIPGKLSGCLENGFTKEEKLQAYKLIILSHLFDDNMDQADATMLQFLNDYPAYEVVATDPREFIALKETYDTKPILKIGGSFGLNFSFPLVTEKFGIQNYNEFNGNFVPGGAGFHGSFRVEKRLKDRIDLSGEFSFVNSRFDFYLDTEPAEGSFTGEITDFSRIEYYEVQNSIYIPLSVSYILAKGDFSPYVSLGLSPGILLAASAEGKREYVNTGNIRFDPVNVANVEIISERRIFNISAFAGAGFRYSIGPGEFFMDARLYSNLKNQVRPGSDRFIQELTWEIFYVNDNFILNNIAVSAGYVLPIYHPKKKGE